MKFFILVGVSCLSGYVKNPYTDTCIRLVEEKVTWSVAKAACESTGEYLAVFDTEEAARWIVNFMKDRHNPDGKPLKQKLTKRSACCSLRPQNNQIIGLFNFAKKTCA